jgi:hypothetical protein
LLPFVIRGEIRIVLEANIKNLTEMR